MPRPLQIYASTQQWRTQVLEALGAGPLATDATTGFFYVPATAGIPTGTPADQPGFSAVTVDETSDTLYFFSNGAWHAA